MIQINIETIPAVLITAFIIWGFGFIWRIYTVVNDIRSQVGTIAPPTGIFEKLGKHTVDIEALKEGHSELREWMIRSGVDRRHPK